MTTANWSSKDSEMSLVDFSSLALLVKQATINKAILMDHQMLSAISTVTFKSNLEPSLL